ncbi:Probable RNA-directed DNA polymerase from transposon BS [Eumeta japonica]|uniref:Probable RNA-directed DNA polymerase from transposon BS n=1 Tax=Eumeta variegata TaxID=151549 RepID=A0A4C1Z1W7_EUMVA|nr:Probable RNA-directed DNA polymerase from transposon BS [Eumeta japonica]
MVKRSALHASVAVRSAGKGRGAMTRVAPMGALRIPGAIHLINFYKFFHLDGKIVGFKKKRKTVAVFFDVAKAFDRVWHAGLIHKLYTLELPDRLVLIIHNYLNNRNFTFRHENTYSTKRTLKAGVPQGSTLSPLLYSAYVNDIPRPSNGVQLALFADDTALYLRGSNFRDTTPRLQRAIDELTRWL